MFSISCLGDEGNTGLYVKAKSNCAEHEHCVDCEPQQATQCEVESTGATA